MPHNLPQDDLIVANSGHGCSTCCREHNMCLECGHKPFATDNTGILYHYFLSCNHRDEDSVYCACQCSVCRRQRETAPVDSPSDNALTTEVGETGRDLGAQMNRSSQNSSGADDSDLKQ